MFLGDKKIKGTDRRSRMKEVVAMMGGMPLASDLHRGLGRKIYPEQTNMIKQQSGEGTYLTHESRTSWGDPAHRIRILVVYSVASTVPPRLL